MPAPYPGTLDDTSWLKPVAHIWTNSAQPWFVFPPGAVKFGQQPPDMREMMTLWNNRAAQGQLLPATIRYSYSRHSIGPLNSGVRRAACSRMSFSIRRAVSGVLGQHINVVLLIGRAIDDRA